MQQEKHVKIAVDAIHSGFLCSSDIRSEDGLLLLGGGQAFSDSIREQIVRRGFTHVYVSQSDVDELGITVELKAKTPQKPQTLFERRVDRRSEPLSQERSKRFAAKSDKIANLLTAVGKSLKSLTGASMPKLCAIPNEIAQMIVEDSDQMVVNLHADASTNDLARRCAQMAVLSINTAIELEHTDREIDLVGQAAMLHDLGQFLLPQRLQDPTSTLEENEKWEYRRHPLLIDKVLADCSVSDEVRLISSQVHEKPDGTGFPRGLPGHALHPLGKIVRVVDAYLTLIHPGPGRPPVLPHDAITFMLMSGQREGFDSTVMRAFLSQLSMFPIGTHVKLSSGESAQVVRRDTVHYTAPILRLDGAPDAETVAVSESNLEISEAFSPADAHMRLQRDMMQSVSMKDFEVA